MPKTSDLKASDIKILDEIDNKLKRRRLDEALDQALELVEKRPKLVDAWIMLFEVALDMKHDMWMLKANRALLELDPDTPRHIYNMVVTATKFELGETTIYYAQEYMQRFPNGQDFDTVQEIYESIYDAWRKIRLKANYPDGATPEELVIMEIGQVFVAYGEIDEGRKYLQRFLKKFPDHVGTANNLAMTYAVDGDLEKALSLTQNLLEDAPGYIHAVSNTAQYLIRLGRQDEAQPYLDRLLTLDSDNPDHWGKKIEAFAYANEDQQLFDLYVQAVKKFSDEGHMAGMETDVHHYAAVAAHRIGKEKVARSLWQMVLKEDPQHDLARLNQENTKLPIGRRHGTWYLRVEQVFRPQWLVMPDKRSNPFSDTASDKERLEETQYAIEVFKQHMPALRWLLLHGSPDGADRVMETFSYLPNEMFIEFAKGQHGTDLRRVDVAHLLAEEGDISYDDPFTMFVKREQREVTLHDFWVDYYEFDYETIFGDDEDDYEMDEDEERLFRKAQNALQQRYPDKAIEYADEGLKFEFIFPVFYRIKWEAYEYKKQPEKALQVIDEARARYSDYLFAEFAKARYLVKEGQADEALDMMQRYLRYQEWSIDHFVDFAKTMLDIYRALGNDAQIVEWEFQLREADNEVFLDYMSNTPDGELLKQIRRIRNRLQNPIWTY